jgi:hypothetical protein
VKNQGGRYHGRDTNRTYSEALSLEPNRSYVIDSEVIMCTIKNIFHFATSCVRIIVSSMTLDNTQ